MINADCFAFWQYRTTSLRVSPIGTLFEDVGDGVALSLEGLNDFILLDGYFCTPQWDRGGTYLLISRRALSPA